MQTKEVDVLLKQMDLGLIEWVNQASQREPLATITASDGTSTWEVRILRRAGYFEVCGRSTSMDVYLRKTHAGYLVSVPNFRRCGIVPVDCSGLDIQEYVGIENPVDATTLAAAIRYLITGFNVWFCVG